MRISEYMNDRKRVTITVTSSIGEETFWVDYKPNAWTYAESERSKGLVGFERLAMQLETMLADWDLTDDEGVKIPITAEAIKAGVSTNLAQLIVVSITQDITGAGAAEEESKND